MKLLICDDQDSLCLYYKKMFSRTEDIEVVGTAHDGDECIEQVSHTMPDILLLDIQMRVNDEGVNIIEELLNIHPALKIIMLTVHKVEEYVFRAFASGAKAFVYKSVTDEEIIDKVRSVYNNVSIIEPDIANVLARKSRDVLNKQKSLLYMVNQITKLSKSEISVLRGVYFGKSYRDIASERFVEEGTVRTQASGILRKFNVKSMHMLIKTLREMELFEFIDLYCNDDEG